MAKEIETGNGTVKITKTESVMIFFPDNSTAVISKVDGDDEHESQELFTCVPIDGESDAEKFTENLTHDIGGEDDPEMWESCPREWTILRAAFEELTGRKIGDEREENANYCASCKNYRPTKSAEE